MSANPTELWNDVKPITLMTGPDLSNDVDRSAAFVISPHQARDMGVLPFRWEKGYLFVATARPLTQSVWNLLDTRGPVRIYRTVITDLLMAQWHIYGEFHQVYPLFGELATTKHGLGTVDLEKALTIQRRQGGLLGEICVSLNALNHWQVAEVLSEQTKIPVINLLSPKISGAEQDQSLDDVWNLLSEDEWRQYDMAPVRQTADEIVIAMVNPFDSHKRLALSSKMPKQVSALLTGRRDIVDRLAHHYRDRDLKLSQTHLLSKNPDDSATRTLTRQQKILLMMTIVIVIGLCAWDFETTLAVISSLLVTAYAILVAHRLWIIRKGTESPNDLRFQDQDLQQLGSNKLPIYTILIPAREEAAVLPMLAEALQRLDYPSDRLDVKLLLEEDDVATITAARQTHLPVFFEIVVVPVAEPRTKPKACNFGLQRARGEFITIYDAEDLPEPAQLKKALLAFERGSDKLACVQAKLSYFNAEQNLLTRWFTAEYGAWFDLFLPALHAANLPIPLGGTSNHFRTKVLREVGAWDPYNVTEDADLGIRLHKAGYRTAVMDSVTYEEANSEFVNWIRQRSRWIKGYLQTWLVHMRHPFQLYRQLGGRGFWGFQLAILGTPLMFILNPIYWFITSLWFMTQWSLIPHLFPPGIYYLGMMNLLIGNFVFTYLNAVGAAKRGNWNLIPYTLLTPIYWSMMSVASWKALLQLLTRPSHWEKTQHGLVDWTKVVPHAAFTPPHSQNETA